MILVLCRPGHVVLAVKDALARLYEPVEVADPSDPDLFARALGCRAIVYVPEPRLLDAFGAIENTDRMRRVVRAAHAPGVRQIVVLEPHDGSFDEEERILKKSGIKHTIVRCAPLLDELADATNLHTVRSMWLPRGRVVTLVTRPALAVSVREALVRDDLSGTIVDVSSERFDVVEAVRRAAAIAGADVRVHGTLPALSAMIRRLTSWLGFSPSAAVAVCDRLVARVPQGVAPTEAAGEFSLAGARAEG